MKQTILSYQDDIPPIEFKMFFGFGDEDILKNLNFKVQPNNINVISVSFLQVNHCSSVISGILPLLWTFLYK